MLSFKRTAFLIVGSIFETIEIETAKELGNLMRPNTGHCNLGTLKIPRERDSQVIGAVGIEYHRSVKNRSQSSGAEALG